MRHRTTFIFGGGGHIVTVVMAAKKKQKQLLIKPCSLLCEPISFICDLKISMRTSSITGCGGHCIDAAIHVCLHTSHGNGAQAFVHASPYSLIWIPNGYVYHVHMCVYTYACRCVADANMVGCVCVGVCGAASTCMCPCGYVPTSPYVDIHRRTIHWRTLAYIYI